MNLDINSTIHKQLSMTCGSRTLVPVFACSEINLVNAATLYQGNVVRAFYRLMSLKEPITHKKGPLNLASLSGKTTSFN